MTTIENQTLFQSVKEIILQSRQRVYRMANSVLLQTYWQIGQLIVEDEQQGNQKAQYGKATLKNLANQLTLEFGKGFDESNLRNMRSFYRVFPIRDALRHELSWTHYRLICRLDSEQKRDYYLQESIENNWSNLTLQRQINSLAFERVLQHKPEETESVSIQNLIKDPYIFEFLGLPANIKNSENSIESAIIDHLQQFLLEFGKGFAFVARQKRIDFDGDFFYVDLVFYHCILKCYLLIDLKIGKLTHQDVGQMDSYVRMVDDLFLSAGDNPTIGLILCSDKSGAIAKYSVLKESRQLFASRYTLHLPTEAELTRELERERRLIESRQSNAVPKKKKR